MSTEVDLASAVGIPITLEQVVVGKHQINYAVAGRGEPLLLIHGANFGWGQWYPNLKALAEQFTVYALDLPGAGRSSRVDYATLDVEEDLLAVVENFIALKRWKRVSIVGASIGGWIAVKIALRHPEIVHKLVLVNSVGFADYMGTIDKMIGWYPLARFLTRTVLKPRRDNKNIEKFLRNIFFNKAQALQPEFVEYFYETMSSSHNLLFISRLTQLTKQLVVTHALPALPHQTLVVWGEQDRIMPLAKNARNFHLIPGATVRLIHEAGHLPSLEQPAVFNSLITEFLTTT